ncbi:Uncharacterised protein (plasmid) [Tsukamurella tyrosinosolvens]|uniref:Uncharacterized protein n=1 Tax=Tsukamurella tyrosinosolvens TaxID=57704 RepID=A0A1H4VN92_TSUTY|nr:hypothetical protein [Tsukamurella tyrosinosolvens]KXO90932.1 hypothetical protein AXK58_21090 [Tsukamurella tyrosinosolvens]SEC82405.1 hypothetical protein SAMN04489793_3281 [Tsukamurella tyrosinosolvens]VEH90411.1 Uncharacterised protein [Tsukamurella tyrosinosolvens]
MTTEATAQVCEIRVREKFIDGTVAQVLRFDPPIVGDDNAEHAFGIACTSGPLVDVYAMDPANPGWIARDEFGGWVTLVNCSLLKRRSRTLGELLASCGIEIVR